MHAYDGIREGSAILAERCSQLPRARVRQLTRRERILARAIGTLDRYNERLSEREWKRHGR